MLPTSLGVAADEVATLIDCPFLAENAVFASFAATIECAENAAKSIRLNILRASY
jgi:hypothetical protein